MEPNLEKFKKELLSHDINKMNDDISAVSDELFFTLEDICNSVNGPKHIIEDAKVLYPLIVNLGPFVTDSLIKILGIMLVKNRNDCAEKFGNVCKFYETVNLNLEAMKAAGQTFNDLNKFVADVIKEKKDESPREES